MAEDSQDAGAQTDLIGPKAAAWPKDRHAPALSKGLHDGVIFDLDGVVTKTADVHAAAWKRLFDAFLREIASRNKAEFHPFDTDRDYHRYVDGKPRYDGVQSFLQSRGISLPYGDPDDDPDKETVCGLGNRKNTYFHEHLRKHGVEIYPSTIKLINDLKRIGFKVAIISSSKNCVAVLEAAGISDLFDAKVDGVDSVELDLKGKPAPDIFLEGARRLGVEPARAVIIEDAISGVEAGRRGGFALVIGVDRGGNRDALEDGGADVVVSDLAEIRITESINESEMPESDLPSALDRLDDIAARLEGRRPAVFLDYDGTLTPIVDDPDKALMTEHMRETVRDLARRCTVAVVSGRDLAAVRNFVQIDGIVYAGSHGFDIAGPQGLHVTQQKGQEYLPELDAAERELGERVARIPGVRIERKKFSIALHYRQVAREKAQDVEDALDTVLSQHPDLRKGRGKMVFELQPRIEWNKGEAIRWLLSTLDLDKPEVLPFYLGDDVTDEDAFRVLQNDGIGILVAESPQPTAARYLLRDPDEVEQFLRRLAELIGETSP